MHNEADSPKKKGITYNSQGSSYCCMIIKKNDQTLFFLLIKIESLFSI